MNEQLRQQIVVESASKVHEDWCMQELNGYFERTKNNFNGNNYGEAFEKGCYKKEQKRNEVELDVVYLQWHETMLNSGMEDFNGFIRLVNKGAVNVKRFVNRNLNNEEIVKAGSNYKNGQENILRSFSELSDDSQKENLDAAIGAVNVYVQLSQAGISIEEMEKNPEIRDLIGIAIHTDWLKRNPNHPNEDLKVPYDQLDEWTQQQDLTVYGAMLNVVKNNPEKYYVPAIEGAIVPDYDKEEKELLGIAASR